MTRSVVALAGGVGGSKLAFGLHAHLGPRLAVIVNTGDDETMYGLRVCPDLDTVRYTLSGRANRQTGWGLEDDTFQAMDLFRAHLVRLPEIFGMNETVILVHVQ